MRLFSAMQIVYNSSYTAKYHRILSVFNRSIRFSVVRARIYSSCFLRFDVIEISSFTHWYCITQYQPSDDSRGVIFTHVLNKCKFIHTLMRLIKVFYQLWKKIAFLKNNYLVLYYCFYISWPATVHNQKTNSLIV